MGGSACKSGSGNCAGTHRAVDGACVPIFDDCPGPTEIPVLGGGCQPVGVQDCGTGFNPDGAGGCEPVLPTAPCGPGTMPRIGSSDCQPVGVGLCSPGFDPDGEGGCAPNRPIDCGDHERAAPGDPGCHPFGDCGTGTWGNITTDASTIFVDAGYTGGASDGSQGAPFLTILEGVAAAPIGGLVAVAAGDYIGKVTLTRPVRLIGRCAEIISIQAPVLLGVPQDAISIEPGASGSLVAGVTVTASGRGLAVDGATGVHALEIQILDTADFGLFLRGGAQLTLERSTIARATGAGVLAAGALLSLDDSVVRDTQPDSGGDFGRGIDALCGSGGCGSVTVQNSIIARNRDTGILSVGVPTEIEGSAIVDTLSGLSDQLLGRGVEARCDRADQICSTLTIQGSFLGRNTDLGVAVTGISAEINDTTVVDTQPKTLDLVLGRGVNSRCDPDGLGCGSLTIRGSLIARNHDVGVASLGSPTVIEDSIIADTLPQQSTQEEGRGLAVVCDTAGLGCGSLTMRRSLLTRNRMGAMTNFGVSAEIHDSAFVDTLPRQSDQRFGTGIESGCNPVGSECGSLTIHGSVVARNHVRQILVQGPDARVERTVASDTVPAAIGPDGGGGIGVQCDSGTLECGSLLIRQSYVARNLTTGVVAFGAPLEIEDSTILDTAPDPVAGDFGVGIGAQCSAVVGDCGSLTVRRSRVARSHDAGLVILGVAARITDSMVVETQPRPADAPEFPNELGQGVFAACLWELGFCTNLEITASSIRSSYNAALALEGTSGFADNLVIDGVSANAATDMFGFGIQIAASTGGLTAGTPSVFNVTGTVISEATLAGILFHESGGTVQDCQIEGGDFSIALGAGANAVIQDDNGLSGTLQDAPVVADLTPSPAPVPSLPFRP